MPGNCDPPKEHQFSSENQPDPSKKRVPKWKSRLKKLLTENYDEISKTIIKKCKDGDIRHIEFMRDWLYGKVKDHVEHSGTTTIIQQYQEMTNEELEKIINE